MLWFAFFINLKQKLPRSRSSMFLNGIRPYQLGSLLTYLHGCQCIITFCHRSSFCTILCPANFHINFATCSLTSLTILLFVIHLFLFLPFQFYVGLFTDLCASLILFKFAFESDHIGICIENKEYTLVLSYCEYLLFLRMKLIVPNAAHGNLSRLFGFLCRVY